MKCESLYSEKNKTFFLLCCLLKCLPNLLGVKTFNFTTLVRSLKSQKSSKY